MATTKIWTIREGSRIKQVIDYVENEEKTVRKVEIQVTSEQGYTDEEMMHFQDVIDVSMEDEMEQVLSYAGNEKKTEKRKYVSAINCSVENCREEMMITKSRYHKKDGILLWHGYQSFKPGEVTPEEAHKIGIELANNLWGDEYEILVCTHLDRAHIHNHFVINSVSFKTGRKLDVRWIDMARESDRLCRQYEKSVIEYPKGKSMHYAAWQAMKEGKPTWISIIKEQVDAVIAESSNVQDFMQKMKQKGYELKVDGKYFSIKPPGKERFVRIDRRLGEAYSLIGIGGQIEERQKSGRRTFMPVTKTYHCSKPVSAPKRKLHGYQALYIRYCYMLGILPKRRISAGKIHYLYHEEITKMHQLRRQTQLLLKNDIHTKQELTEEQERMKQDLRCYREEKKRLLKTTATTPEAREENKKTLEHIDWKIRKLYRDIKDTERIQSDYERLHDKFIRIQNEKGAEREWKEAEKQR